MEKEIDPPNCTYQKYKIVSDIIKIKISEIVEAKGEYNMYKLAMTCYELTHHKYRPNKRARDFCCGCAKTYNRDMYKVEISNLRWKDVYLCRKCSETIGAKFLVKKGNLFYFDSHNPNHIPRNSWISKLSLLAAIELIDDKHIRLHKVTYKTINEFLNDPLTLNDKLGGCQRTFYVGAHCRFCARKIDCYWGICDSCHRMRDALLKSRVWIFMYNEYGFPFEITKYIIELLMNRHNSFKLPSPCIILDTFT